jgi:hypothetical protein
MEKIKIKIELDRIKKYLNDNNSLDVSLEQIEEQLKLFFTGVNVPVLIKPATVGDGIVRLVQEEYNELLSLHKEALSNNRLIKFVPASGAASRMFQKLLSVMNRFNNFSLQDIEKTVDDKEAEYVYRFLINLNKFAFYDDLKTILNANEIEIKKLILESPAKIIKAVLHENGLNYSSKPKGAIKFHSYKTGGRTAFEEQIYEAISYQAGDNGYIKLHFTISKEHEGILNHVLKSLKNDFAGKYDLNISYSYQKKSTDTIAVDHHNKLLFDKSGKPVHRPGGHGALLENLNDLNADIIIIKNIDNVSTENLNSDTVLYKKLLTGYLLKMQKKIFEFLEILESRDSGKINLDEIIEFIQKKLFITTQADFDKLSVDKKIEFIFKKLNRPIRVCGMVKNEGEPGGGPFWMKNNDGTISLQIIEQAQINLNDNEQVNIVKSSTHFNPVDLVCGIKDFKGDNFDLHKFVDHCSGIITKKSKDGAELKALELPGLWNGSMADWITIFVEVPITTFNPVKEVNDLLRKEHQGSLI